MGWKVAMKKIFHIENMLCSNCVMHLEALEDELPGIIQIHGSYQKQQLIVEFNETQISENQIRSAIQELGYSSE